MGKGLSFITDTLAAINNSVIDVGVATVEQVFGIEYDHKNQPKERNTETVVEVVFECPFGREECLECPECGEELYEEEVD